LIRIAIDFYQRVLLMKDVIIAGYRNIFNLRAAVIALALLFIAGIFLIYYFVQYEKNRDVIIWQDKLLQLTSMETRAVDNWVGDHIKGVAAIADNTTVKLYVSSLLAGGQEPEQASYSRYIRELLIVKSSELGFDTGYAEGLNFNRGIEPQSGLLIVDPQGKFIASGNAGFKLPDSIAGGVKTGRFGKSIGVEDLPDRENKSLRLGFVAPIYPPQTNRDDPNAQPIAYLVGVRDAGKHLIRLLRGNYLSQADENISLLKKADNNIVYLLNLKDDPPLLSRVFAFETPELAAAAAVKNPGQFQQKIDYSGREVLLQSATLQYLPWVLMHQIDKERALFESHTHAELLYSGFGIVFLLLVCSLILIWRHGASVRYQRTLTEMTAVNDELAAKNELFKSITDNIGQYMMIVDQNYRLIYGNKALANISGHHDSFLVGKNLTSILGASAARRLEHGLAGKHHDVQLITLDDEHGKILHASRIPLPEEDGKQRSIIVATDISETLHAQKQKEKITQQAVLMLSKTLERHDPYSAQHSERVKKVAVAIGHELGLTEQELFNLALSASLINAGKFYVPAELLCKPGKLTDDEYATVKSHILHTLKMLEEIEMDRDIVLSVSQSYERLDGSGYPSGLRDHDICLTARIIAVANTFAAMICPRSWRQAIAPRQVLDILMQDVGYDRKIVVALANFVENKGGADLNG
jgi:PAS domain S-box-containing protein